MGLSITWFILIAILWAGFFVLEGFDLGVGMLHSVVGRTEEERNAAVATIGPFWDGNEVWLIVAGAGMFAAFPSWYATMFSAFYLPLVLLLVALIVRGVSFEFREKVHQARWRTTWQWCLTIGSLLIPLLAGVAIGDLLAGIPIDAHQEFTGNFFDLLTPYGLYVGVTFTLLCLVHGALFLALKSTGTVRQRSERLAAMLSPVMAVAVIGFTIWTLTQSNRGDLPSLLELIAIMGSLAAVWLAWEQIYGWAFAATTVTVACSVLAVFADLYPRVMVSSTSARYNLTVTNTTSSHYALTVMTIVAVTLLPFVLAYQGWTYYVFRARVRVSDETPPAVPAQSQPS
ncbi:MAG TPA: cytochrome d ubiquinol oxidase subunit II [Mycobacteriales bacterium]|nr:cytochrome d ubiquinol oxidase subunit II [Mycobacteriales bacterium]